MYIFIGNPIDCNCHVLEFFYWLSRNKELVTDAQQIKCSAAVKDSKVFYILASLIGYYQFLIPYIFKHLPFLKDLDIASQGIIGYSL